MPPSLNGELWLKDIRQRVGERIALYGGFNERVLQSEDPEEVLRFATAIGGRYMGADRAEEFGHRNAALDDLLVRVTPSRVLAEDDITG